MSIRIVRYLSDVTVGKWVNIESPIRHSYAGVLGMVTDVSKTTASVNVYRASGPVVERYPARRLCFVCDTREEAQFMFDQSMAFARKALRHESSLQNRITKSRKADIDRALFKANTRGV